MMLKTKIKKILTILFIIILLILLFFAIRTLAFKVFIYPNWLTQSLDDISEVHIYSEFLDLELTDQEMIINLYNLCKNTKIEKLEFDTSHGNSEQSDCFSIKFIYQNNSYDYIMCRQDAIVKKQPEGALFWTRGEKNEELLSLLLEIENSENLDIIAEQAQIFTEVEGYLEEYEQDFNKIIRLAKEDESAQKEDGSGYISLAQNHLEFNNSELEKSCLSLMKKINISDISFGKDHISFYYKSNPDYMIDIIYNYNDDEEERESLGYVVKRIIPFYYVKCIALKNQWDDR